MANPLVETELTREIDKHLRQHPEVEGITTAERPWNYSGPNWSYYFVFGPRKPIKPNDIDGLNNFLTEVNRALLKHRPLQQSNLYYDGSLNFGCFIYEEQVPIQANTVVTYQAVSQIYRGSVITLPQATQLSQRSVLVQRAVVVRSFPNADLAYYVGSYLNGIFEGTIVEDPAITALFRGLSKEQVATLTANKQLQLPEFREPILSR